MLFGRDRIGARFWIWDCIVVWTRQDWGSVLDMGLHCCLDATGLGFGFGYGTAMLFERGGIGDFVLGMEWLGGDLLGVFAVGFESTGICIGVTLEGSFFTIFGFWGMG